MDDGAIHVKLISNFYTSFLYYYIYCQKFTANTIYAVERSSVKPFNLFFLMDFLLHFPIFHRFEWSCRGIHLSCSMISLYTNSISSFCFSLYDFMKIVGDIHKEFVNVKRTRSWNYALLKNSKKKKKINMKKQLCIGGKKKKRKREEEY